MDELCVDIGVIPEESLKDFTALTPAVTYENFVNSPHRQEWLAVGAYFFGKPVGVALARMNPVTSEALIVYVSVASRYRGRGVGSRLLRAIEERLFEAGMDTLFFRFITSRHETDTSVEAVLNRGGWGKPSLQYLLFNLYPSAALTARFLVPPKQYDNFTVEKWTELSADKLRRLQDAEPALIREDRLYLTPFVEGMDPCTSVGLCHDGAIVGWMITKLASDGACIFEALYILREFRESRWGLLLLLDSGRRWCECGHPRATFYISPARTKPFRFQHFLKEFNPEIREVHIAQKCR